MCFLQPGPEWSCLLQEQVNDTSSVYLLPVAASLELLGLLSREMCCYTPAVLKMWQFVKQKGSICDEIHSATGISDVFVAKEVVDHEHKSLYNKNCTVSSECSQRPPCFVCSSDVS